MKHEHYMDMNRLSDWSVDQINELLDVCLLLKEMEEKGVRLPLLKNVSLAMMFDQQSTRTRVSFETAMQQLGGHAGARFAPPAKGTVIDKLAAAGGAAVGE